MKLVFPAILLSLLLLQDVRAEKPYILLGPQQIISDQPYVDVEVFDANGASLGPEGGDGGLFGYNMYAHLLLDTGANGILIVDAAAQSLQDNGLVSEAEFLEMGVAGYTIYEVSSRYRVDFTGTDGVTRSLPITADGTRMQLSAESQLGGPIDWGGIPGLIGMPAMTGRVTTLDMSHWSGMQDLFDFLPMSVTFPEGQVSGAGIVPVLPGGTGHRYTVLLDNRMRFDAADGRPDWEDPDSPLPTYADVPFLTGEVRTVNEEGQALSKTRTFLLDTGAQLSMISRNTAFALGLDADGDGDLEDDAIDFQVIGGVGGEKRVPIHVVDQFRLPTEEGVDLVWAADDPEYSLGIEFIVLDLFKNADGSGDGRVGSDDLDIVRAHWGTNVFPGDVTRGDYTAAGDADFDGVVGSADLDLVRSQWGQDVFLDGIIGVDLLTAGLDMLALLGGQSAGDPYFEKIHFDFRDWASGSGTMVLDISPSHDVVIAPPAAAVPEPGAAALLVLAGLLISGSRYSAKRVPEAVRLVRPCLGGRR